MKFSGEFDTPFGALVQRHSSLLHLKSGEILFEENDPQKGLYLISSGILAASAKMPDGKRRFLYPAFHGTAFSPFPTGRNKAFVTVTALSSSYVYLLPHEAFMQMMRTNPQFVEMVGDLLNRTIGLLQARIIAGSVESAAERIRAFIRLQDAFQPFLGPDAATPIEERLSQTMLAEMTGVSRPYFNQQLKLIRAEIEQRRQAKQG